ncbi:hypothetical protein [Ottowia testudinis]|uniref:Nitrogen fixation protein FixH n=1 Tax=Ottowia testudinis TaxID=2816950 RepID=A0A975H1V3_9BURK|nr:hypothetical protein [Ottowia testudinis]QTD44223.1 hypothetical protein J1M35_13955 [Ottowia testudinis]
MSSIVRADSAAAHSGPWWRHRLMWMVVGGPLIVVVASFVTLYLAISRPDPVYSDAQRRPDAPVLQPADEQGKAELTPAMQARNHAATGGVPPAVAASAPR